jgi:phage FluMu gp28-like protein
MQIEVPEPHPNQEVILNSPARFIVVMCGRRFGKSELCQVKIISEAIRGKKVAYITPTYKLAKRFFEKLAERLPFQNNKSDLIIDFPNKGVIEFFTGERLDNLRGRKFDLVVVDEASYIPDLENGWLNSIRPTLTDYQGKAIFLSTPKGKNYFYALYLKGQSDKDWQSFKYTTYDNPYILRSEIDDARIELPDAVFNQEYLADPMENAANPFGIVHIKNCIAPQSKKEPMYFGVDLAKSYDWSVIIGLDVDGCVAYYERFQKDWKQTKEHILTLNRIRPVYIDSTGVGDAITEDLQRHFQNMHGYKYNSKSKQQLMELLASKIQTKQVKFPDGMIVQELEIFEYQFTPTGVKYNAPNGFNDDCVNALALAVRCMDANKHTGVYHFI